MIKNEQLKMMEDEIKREHRRKMQKPAPLPKTKIEQKAETMKGYTNSYEINIINKKDPLEQLKTQEKLLRAAPPKYRLNREIAKKWNFFKLAQNEVLRALVAKL